MRMLTILIQQFLYGIFILLSLDIHVSLFICHVRLFIHSRQQLIGLLVLVISIIYGDISLLRAILKSNCYHKEGHDAPCEYGDSFFMLLFGVVQILFSQIPDFHNMEWLSIIATIMSFSYTFIGLALSLAKVVGTFHFNITFPSPIILV